MPHVNAPIVASTTTANAANKAHAQPVRQASALFAVIGYVKMGSATGVLHRLLINGNKLIRPKLGCVSHKRHAVREKALGNLVVRIIVNILFQRGGYGDHCQTRARCFVAGANPPGYTDAENQRRTRVLSRKFGRKRFCQIIKGRRSAVILMFLVDVFP